MSVSVSLGDGYTGTVLKSNNNLLRFDSKYCPPLLRSEDLFAIVQIAVTVREKELLSDEDRSAER